jgi:hypothetical protein
MIKVLFLCFLGVFISCNSVKNKASLAEINALKAHITSKQTTVTFNWARPIGLGNTNGLENLLPPGSNLNAINLIGNTNFYKLKNDSIYLELPYYGRQFYANYNTDNGISFKGIPKQTKSYTNIKKGTYVTTHVFTTNGEAYTATLTFYTNNTCNLHIISNKRTAVNYDGKWHVNLQPEQTQNNSALINNLLNDFTFVYNNSVVCVTLFSI